MGKFYGTVGFGVTVESDSNGVWEQTDVVERRYHGDVIENGRNWQSGENLQDNLVLVNQIDILADSYAYKHFGDIRYVKWMGNLWKVTSIRVTRPRLHLTIGGVYNGPTPASS